MFRRCFGTVVLVELLFLLDSRFGITRGRTWHHLVSLSFTWCHSDLVLRHSVSLGVTRFHLVSLGFTWCHSVSLRPHSVSLGVTFVSLGFTWCHSVSPKPGTRDSRVRSRMTWVHSGVLRRSDGVFFLPLEKKKTTWHYLDTFFLPKNRFSRKLQLPVGSRLWNYR